MIERTSFTIASVGGSTRIVADAAFITNSGSAFEQVSGRGAINTPALQQLLDEVAAAARNAQSVAAAAAAPAARTASGRK